VSESESELIVSLICSPATAVTRIVAGSVAKPCAVCEKDVWLSPSGQREYAKPLRRLICAPCANAEMAQHGGAPPVVVTGISTEQLQEVIETVGPDALFAGLRSRLATNADIHLDIVVAVAPEVPPLGPPPTYRGPKVGQTLTHEGRDFLCVGVERSKDHQCDLGDLCGGAWEAQLVAEESFER
jgi:hypothetical protein